MCAKPPHSLRSLPRLSTLACPCGSVWRRRDERDTAQPLPPPLPPPRKMACGFKRDNGALEDPLVDSVANLSYTNPAFILTHGLNPKNILTYFYASPFYVRCGGHDSLNELRRRGSSQDLAAATDTDGHEFILAWCNADAQEGRTETSVFVLQKVVRRVGRDGAVPSDVFYVLAGTVYKAPQIGEVFETALAGATRAAGELLGRQTEDLRRKRRRITSRRAQSMQQNWACVDPDCPDEAEVGGLPPWPSWCIFERHAAPSAWVSEALTTASAAAAAAMNNGATAEAPPAAFMSEG